MASQVGYLAVGLENSALPRFFHRIPGVCIYCVSGWASDGIALGGLQTPSVRNTGNGVLLGMPIRM